MLLFYGLYWHVDWDKVVVAYTFIVFNEQVSVMCIGKQALRLWIPHALSHKVHVSQLDPNFTPLLARDEC